MERALYKYVYNLLPIIGHSCQRCSESRFPCGWCVMDGQCIEETNSCPTKGPIVISEAVNVSTHGAK